MKKLFLLPLVLFALQVQAQTLFSFGNHKVDKSEFMNAFRKNNISEDTGKSALHEYLQLFIAYKLKLQEAKDMHMDTLPSLEADVQSFRHQIEKNFLFDREEMQALTAQALARGRKDIHVKTIFIHAPESKDSLKARKEASDLYRSLQSNPMALPDTPEKNGLKISTQDLGYITVFTLPYDIENFIYNLKPGQWSKPFSFDDGYYLFKNEKERPAVGKMKIAQILITTPRNTPEEWQKAKKRADSLYAVLKNGGDFALLAKQFSDDRTTFFNGGEMPEFSVGKYDPQFESHVYSLSETNKISAPFSSDYGYHILKYIQFTPVSQLTSDEYHNRINQELLHRNRVSIAKEKLLQKARVLTGFKDHHLPKNDVYKVTDTSLIANKNITSGKVSIESYLLSFNDGTSVNMGAWDQFLRNSGRLYTGQFHEVYETLWPEFVSQSILENYTQRLENFDPDFASQLREFRDGNMLFELMQKKIWTRAANDTSGLQKYYQQHKNRYRWGRSADAIVFFCNNEDAASHIIKELKVRRHWRDIIQDNTLEVQADSGRFQFDQLPLNAERIKTGISQVILNKFDNTASFVQILKIYPANEQRNFADAKGLVIEDYQKQLEEEWVKELKKKYPVRLNEDVWASLLR